MVDDVTVEVSLDLSSAAADLRTIGDVFHDAADRLEAEADG